MSTTNEHLRDDVARSWRLVQTWARFGIENPANARTMLEYVEGCAQRNLAHLAQRTTTEAR